MKPSPKSAFASDERRATKGAKAFALKTETLRDAAKQNYDVADGVCDIIVLNVLGMLDKDDDLGNRVLGVLVEKSTEYSRAEVEERPSPRAEALQIRQDVVDALVGLDFPEGYTVVVSRVMRFMPRTDCETHSPREKHCQECQPITSVLVTISAPLQRVRERIVVVKAE